MWFKAARQFAFRIQGNPVVITCYDNHGGLKSGNLMEGVKKIGSIMKAAGGLVKLPFVRSSAGRLLGVAGACSAILTPAGLAIGGGVAAVGGAVALGCFGKKAFTEIRTSLPNDKSSS